MRRASPGRGVGADMPKVGQLVQNEPWPQLPTYGGKHQRRNGRKTGSAPPRQCPALASPSAVSHTLIRPLIRWRPHPGLGWILAFGVNRLLNVDKWRRASKVEKPAFPHRGHTAALARYHGFICWRCICPPNSLTLGRQENGHPRPTVT